MRRAAVANRTKQSKALKVISELDAFPKVPDSFKQTTASGGGISIATFAFIVILVISEVQYYTATQLKFDYVVDTTVDGKIKINIDMTVAMRCDYIGADVLDQTGQDAQSFGKLTLDNTYFELSENQRRYHEITREINNYMRDEYHAIQELMWLSGHHPALKLGMPDREDKPSRPTDACRIHGSLEVSKVAGNFHITAGKYFPQLQFGLGHVHLETFMSSADYNFTHRIEHFSFGEKTGGIINPLDGEEQVTHSNYHMFQYFMQIVPTDVKTYTNDVSTYQYSVTDRSRKIDHSGGSHGVPGIFVKYDVFPFKIVVREEHRPYSQFLIRLCGIVGGVFVVSGLLHNWVGTLVDILCCRYKLGKYNPNKAQEPLLINGSDDSRQSHELFKKSSDSFNPVTFLEPPSPVNNLGIHVSQDISQGSSPKFSEFSDR